MVHFLSPHTLHFVHQVVRIDARANRQSFILPFAGANEFHFAISHCIGKLNTMQQMSIRHGFQVLNNDSLQFSQERQTGTEWARETVAGGYLNFVQ